MTIGERIKELRTEANLRQSELGKAIGFSAQVVSNVERGYSFPSTEFVNRSAACFGVPADYILGRTTSRYAVADPKEVSAVQARIMTTGLAGGLLCPYKGLIPACARKAH